MESRCLPLAVEADVALIHGVNVAAVTPRREDSQAVDLAAALELIDSLCDSGVNGIGLLGSTGEFLHFDLNDRVRLIQFAVKRSRVPVIANVSHSLLDGAVSLARQAVAQGAAALLLMPPYFFRYRQEQIKEFYLRFAHGLGEAVPVFLYNVPAFTNEISSETAVELLSTGLFAGIKDSSSRIDYFLQMKALRDRRPFTFLVGNDKIFTEARMQGADGVVSGVACAIPELMLGLDHAILAGAAEQTERLEARLQEFISRVDSFPTPVGIKEAVTVRGLTTGPLSVPLDGPQQRRLTEFREWFQGWLPAVQKEASGA
jgi:4-hydroxy-tetrahydrodipicolinate synthase